MARSNIPPQKLQEIREFAAQWGKIVARRAFGESGPGLEVDFQAMEEVAAAAAAGLTEGTFTTLLEQQAQALNPEHPCPDCKAALPGGPGGPTSGCPGGQLTYHEPVCHCPVCRRDFFPLRAVLRLDGHGYSPATLFKIAEASAKLPSHANAAYALSLTGLQISPRHVCSIATEIGLELAAARDDKVARRQQAPTADAGGPATRGGRRGSRWRAGGHARAVLRPLGASTPAQGREDRLPGQHDRRQLRGRPPAGAAAVAGVAPAGPAAGPADPRLARGYDPGGRRARGYAATTGTSGGLVA